MSISTVPFLAVHSFSAAAYSLEWEKTSEEEWEWPTEPAMFAQLDALPTKHSQAIASKSAVHILCWSSHPNSSHRANAPSFLSHVLESPGVCERRIARRKGKHLFGAAAMGTGQDTPPRPPGLWEGMKAQVVTTNDRVIRHIPIPLRSTKGSPLRPVDDMLDQSAKGEKTGSPDRTREPAQAGSDDGECIAANLYICDLRLLFLCSFCMSFIFCPVLFVSRPFPAKSKNTVVDVELFPVRLPTAREIPSMSVRVHSCDVSLCPFHIV